MCQSQKQASNQKKLNDGTVPELCIVYCCNMVTSVSGNTDTGAVKILLFFVISKGICFKNLIT